MIMQGQAGTEDPKAIKNSLMARLRSADLKLGKTSIKAMKRVKG